MTLLVDTQVLIWLLDEKPEIGPIARRQLSDPRNVLLASYFSFFEMAIKASIGKLSYDPAVIDELPKMGVALVLAKTENLQNYQIHNPANIDPFDNMLITVALAEAEAFVTSDHRIINSRVPGLQIINVRR